MAFQRIALSSVLNDIDAILTNASHEIASAVIVGFVVYPGQFSPSNEPNTYEHFN
jgi:hypothetical protein